MIIIRTNRRWEERNETNRQMGESVHGQTDRQMDEVMDSHTYSEMEQGITQLANKSIIMINNQ